MATTVRTKLKCSGPYLWVYKKKGKKGFECLSVVYIALHVYIVLVHCIDYYIVVSLHLWYFTAPWAGNLFTRSVTYNRITIVELSNGTLNVRRKTRFISLLDIIMSAQFATNVSENDNASQFHPTMKRMQLLSNERKGRTDLICACLVLVSAVLISFLAAEIKRV